MDILICRICLQKVDSDNSLPIKYVANIIIICASVKIEDNDGLPRWICKLCSNKARDAYDFKILCEKSDEYLRNINLSSVENELEVTENIVSNTKLEDTVIEDIKVEESDEYNASTSNEPMLKSTDSEEKSNTSDKNREKFKCHSCDMFFFYKKRLIKHEQQHKEGFNCKDCGKGYASAKHLAVHISIKKRKGSHLCQVCGKSYTMPENLKRHQRVHDGIRPFSCQLCNKSFTQSNELKSHMISHSIEKKFLCSFCGHKYSRERSLQVHISRLHTEGPNQFVCELCGRAFKGLVDMRTHKLIHVQGKSHICKVCNKGFNKNSNLKVHERIHTGHKPFVCQICQKGFIQKHVLTKHLNTHLTM